MVWICGICWTKLEDFAPQPPNGFAHQRAEVIQDMMNTQDFGELEEVLRETELRLDLAKVAEGVKKQVVESDFSTFMTIPCGHCFHKECLKEWAFTSTPNQNLVIPIEERDYRCPYCNQEFRMGEVIRCFPAMLAEEKIEKIPKTKKREERTIFTCGLPFICFILAMLVMNALMTEKIETFDRDMDLDEQEEADLVLLGYDFAYLALMTGLMCFIQDIYYIVF